MSIEVEAKTPAEIEADVLVVGVAEGDEDRAGAGLDATTRSRIAALVADGEATGRFGEATIVHLGDGAPTRRVVVAGLGKRIDADAVRTAAAAGARAARRVGRTIAYLVDDSLPPSMEEQARAAADGVVLGTYDPARWRTRDDDRAKPFDRLLLAGADGAAGEAAKRAAQVAEWANRARDLSNAPPNELTPQQLTARATEYANDAGNVKTEGLGRKQIETLGMGAFAGVAQGAHNEPQLIVLRYDPPDANEELTLGLVGKAITFDTGGISLKPSLHMQNMKGDMSGGAAVIAAICAIADLKIP